MNGFKNTDGGDSAGPILLRGLGSRDRNARDRPVCKILRNLAIFDTDETEDPTKDDRASNQNCNQLFHRVSPGPSDIYSVPATVDFAARMTRAGYDNLLLIAMSG